MKLLFKNKNYAIWIFLLFFAGILFFVSCSFVVYAQTGPYDYVPLEPIPGSAGTTDLPAFIQAIYKFGIWIVGIAAVLMITIGGFMYMVSAGNTSKMDSAKQVITDALWGLVIALGAYLILYVINPDLVRINILLRPISTQAPGGPSAPSGGSGGYVAGGCTPLTTGPCSVDNLRPYFGANAEKASAICNRESGGVETRASTVDICQPSGPVVSWGLFQFNLTANTMGGLNCPRAFDRMYTGSNRTCSVTDRPLYDRCVAAARIPETNIRAAVQLSNNGTNWNRWGANSVCRF